MTLPSLHQLFSDPTRKLFFEGRLLCLDPGETTGVAVMECGLAEAPNVVEQIQINTKDPESATMSLMELFARVRPKHVVMEDYRVYKHKQEEHTHSDLMTPQVIGMVKFLCVQNKILPSMQMASQAKGFVDDDKLRAWGLWIRGKKHARDAIRHGIYYLLFTHTSKKERERQDAYRNKGNSEG